MPESVHTISLKRLALAALVEVALCALLVQPGEIGIVGALPGIGMACVFVYAAVPSPGVTSAFLLVVSAVLAYAVACILAYTLIQDQPSTFAIALSGFVGAALFSLSVHGLLFGNVDFPASFLIGISTLPAALVEPLFASHSVGFRAHHVAWSLLFAASFALASSLYSRTARSGSQTDALP